jgi:hypothetical protein
MTDAARNDVWAQGAAYEFYVSCVTPATAIIYGRKSVAVENLSSRRLRRPRHLGDRE